MISIGWIRWLITVHLVCSTIRFVEVNASPSIGGISFYDDANYAKGVRAQSSVIIIGQVNSCGKLCDLHVYVCANFIRWGDLFLSTKTREMLFWKENGGIPHDGTFTLRGNLRTDIVSYQKGRNTLFNYLLSSSTCMLLLLSPYLT